MYYNGNRVARDRYWYWGPSWALCPAFLLYIEGDEMDLKKPVGFIEQISKLKEHKFYDIEWNFSIN